MKRILRYLRSRRFESDLAAELKAHLDEKVDDLVADGLPPEQARAQAVREFGNRTRLAETCREQWAFAFLDATAPDVRYALRALRKSPVFTVVAVSSLALGIAANTVIFSAVDHVLVRSLPYPHADRLYVIWSLSEPHGAEPMHVSVADFYDWRAQSRCFASLAAYASWPMNLTGVDEPRRLQSQLVSANFFTALGAVAQVGRTFLPDEDQEQSPPVVVLSHHLWGSMGESPAIIGTRITLNGSEATVIGVMPADFVFPSVETDAWVPLSLNAANRANREGRWLKVIGRLASRSNAREAAVEMDIITRRLAAAYPKTNTGWSAAVVPLQQEVVGAARPVLLTLQGGTLLLLLITCVNLANLLLARGASRSREIGLRAALGAGRVRILRQLLMESTLLAALGGSLGVALAGQGIAVARTFGAGIIPRAREMELSDPVVLFAVAVTLATVLVFGLVPALAVSRIDLRAQIGSAGRGAPRGDESKRGVLVAIEVGLATVLLVSAALLGESIVRLLAVPSGLRTDHALTARLTLSRSQYRTNAAQNAFFQDILERVRAIPGVISAGEISETPLQGNNPSFEFVIEGRTRLPSEPPIQAGLRAISSGYFSAGGIPLLGGRDFEAGDGRDSLPVAIVNQTMAHRCWPGADPRGRRLRFKDEQRWITVVGVVADIKHMGLTADEGAVAYIPYPQKTQDWLCWTTLLVRTSGPPLDITPTLRLAVHTVDRNQPVAEIDTLESSLRRSTTMPRLTAVTIGVLSGCALLIAVIGVYGLLAYSFARRTPELGIRLALGASPFALSWLLLRNAAGRVFAGISGGLLLAWWVGRFLQTLLFGVHPHDPAIFAGVAGVLVLASAAAVLAPARRAMRMDPMTALRTE